MEGIDQTILDQIPKAVIVMGKDEGVIVANKVALDAYGDLVGSSEADIAEHIVGRVALEGGRELLTLRLVRPDQIPFTLLFDDSQAANLLCDYKMKAIRVNEAFAKWSGYTREEIEGKMAVGNFVPLEDRVDTFDRARRRIQGEALPEVNDMRGLPRSGEIQHIRVRTILVPGLPYVIYSILDIGPIKRKQQSDAMYQNLLEHCGSGIVVLDPNHIVQYVNQEMQRLTGYTEEEAIGILNGLELLTPASRAYAAERTRMRIAGDTTYESVAEFQVVRKDGTIRDTFSISSQIPNTDDVMLSFFDISDRKKAEQELAVRLKQEELLSKIQHEFLHIDATNVSERLQAALDLLREFFDADRLVLNLFRPATAGSSWCSRTDDAPPTMVVEPDVLEQIESAEEAYLLNADGSPDAFQSIREHMIKWGVTQFALAPYEAGGDEYRLTLERSENTDWTPGRIAFLETPMALIANTVERIEAEKEREVLQRQVWESHKLESVGVLAGGIAHDFNNMLAAILGNAELALENLDKPEAAKECLGDLLQAGDRARTLVSQILAFARHSDAKPEPVNVERVCEEALALLRASIPTTVSLEIHPRFNDAWVLGDSTQLLQVVMNLCTNAYQAIGDHKGEIHLSIDPVANQEDPRLEGDRAYAKIVVEDTGPGIDEAVMERIFDPFFTTKDPGEGTGMGLSMVHGIVTSSGGHVAAVNTSRGARFTMYLPLTDRRPLKAVEKAPTSLEGDGQTILVVDDDAGVLKLVASMLRSLKYKVETFSDPQAAVHCFQRTPDAFDLILTDLTMPGLTGNEVAEHVKGIRRVPVIAISGYSQAGADMDVIDAFLPKPFQRADLAQILESTLAAATNSAGTSSA